ncbi:MAG: DUF4139 domain-containing protein [Betaproteobacteria bacterium]|nr:DUF4139 domain-containing protein [Betaproteobacteria bacterium]MCL2887595.1 DUF4139 domain-containing protein [Betaproteobacteria bacterium]
MPLPSSRILLRCLAAAPIVLAVLPASAHADTGASHVARVTVYPGSATVERVLRLAPGARQASFACLPAGLDAASLQVNSDASVRVGEIALRQQTRELLGNACISPLEERIRVLENQIAALQAESAGMDYALIYLKSFENAGSGADAKPSSAAQIGATVAALRQNAQASLTRQHQLKRQQEALERDLKPLLAERDRVGSGEARVSVVQVSLAAPQGGELRLTYQVRGPGWQPTYRATLDSATKKLRLERQALVAQNTGEDWEGVQLTLSTGQPGAATQGPLPWPWRVGIAPPVVAARAQYDAMPMPVAAPEAAAPAMDNRLAKQPPADDMPRFDVSISESGFATEFAVPQRISVPANGQRITLALGEQALEARLVARTSPLQDASAYLVAEVAPPPGVWPAGPVNLYRDGAYVGSGRFDPAQLARNGLSFGRDELLNVRVERPERTDGTGGFIGNRNERRVSRAFTVENRHREAITLQVLDAAPLSEHQDVRVESRFQPEPKDKSWREQPGTVLWEQGLEAGATQRFSAEHLITWPKDARLRD